MDENILKATKKFVYIMIIYFIIVIGIVVYTNVQNNNNTSSPVEGIYHRELVNTIDSILDARCIDNTTFSCDSICGCME